MRSRSRSILLRPGRKTKKSKSRSRSRSILERPGRTVVTSTHDSSSRLMKLPEPNTEYTKEEKKEYIRFWNGWAVRASEIRARWLDRFTRDHPGENWM